ncbi:DUF475 domain-containing protein [Helicobacter aurati]|uniref:DUF475 domain-containing protein n=1 Tax=Helicobacter aurati TaxID=137778 RepID=A0A3D8J7Q3_9HELI|nr:DUF475 domain-containing protein [Helicobacter aurati]RDU72914.1 DUF475 domain-containing protein [Helicobacter aurati]
MKHFYSSFFITIIGLSIAFSLGSWQAACICALLSILEVSLSFDNAVVNAKVLHTMDIKWRKRFIYWGIPIAVFGMRFIFPIVIVSVAGQMGFYDTLHIAIHNPEKYHKALENNIAQVYAFGGAFLIMVFLHFFFDSTREEQWLTWIESNPLTKKLANIPNISLLCASSIGVILLLLTKEYMIGVAYFSALLLYLLLSAFSSTLGDSGVRSGLMGFLYLEVLDASFSFDGVIGAFALSNDIFIIMIGLGVGAMFVRSITLYLVEKQTLQEYIYLEHGAHYAICALACIMLLKIFIEISEVITGLIGIGFIALAFICSKLAQSKIK